MKTRSPLLIFALFAIAAFGINSVMFTELSHEMAATSGLSTDEVEQVKIGFMITQVLGFMFTPILVRKLRRHCHYTLHCWWVWERTLRSIG